MMSLLDRFPEADPSGNLILQRWVNDNHAGLVYVALRLRCGCAALRCAALCCAVLRCAALRCAALRCAVLRCVLLLLLLLLLPAHTWCRREGRRLTRLPRLPGTRMTRAS